jgi:hypothetical protein
MAIPKTAPRTIMLVGKEVSVMKELVAGGTITPGMLLAINSSGQYIAHAVAAADVPPIFAQENDFNGKGIDDNYVANDWVQAWVCGRGAEVNALVAAAATAIPLGSYVESAGNGTVRVYAAGKRIGQALEAVDNSGGGSAARIKILIG